jgi:hypothetical protein
MPVYATTGIIEDGGTAPTTAPPSFPYVANTVFTILTAATTTTTNATWIPVGTSAITSTTADYLVQAVGALYSEQIAWNVTGASGGGGSLGQMIGQPPFVQRPRLRTPEEKVERKRVIVRRASARMRALSLLLDQMTDEQRATYHEHGHFSKTMYRIRGQSFAGNVDVLTVDGRVSMRLCAHANANEIPLPDQLLAQKLMLEFNEDEFLRIANRHAA